MHVNTNIIFLNTSDFEAHLHNGIVEVSEHKHHTHIAIGLKITFYTKPSFVPFLSGLGRPSLNLKFTNRTNSPIHSSKHIFMVLKNGSPKLFDLIQVCKYKW